MFAFISKRFSLLIQHDSKHFSQESPSLWKMILSVLAAIFGVQSEQNRQRDFSKGSVWRFAILGLIALIVFIIAVILLTRWALSLAGA
ncbi:DUF2970 domain-containing protein [Neptunomonas sp.]|uniref:DUF2970 domain-containing protein n=1 Tax=Neptunomonas sp. TaxID=1971898 RepID=UPI003565B664